jgi:hypothetical protein
MTPLHILEILVAFDTCSERSNLPLAHWVADYLRGLGVEEALAQFHMDRVTQFSKHSYERLFRSMMDADREHVSRLRAALVEHGG